MVPSWTETLLSAKVEVVGRTRFCIHPKDLVSQIPVVGGTKDIDWDKVKSLQADLLILDREENPRWMAEQSVIPYFDTHVQSIADVPKELKRLSLALNSAELEKMSIDWLQVINAAGIKISSTWAELPGVLTWIQMPKYPIKQVAYLIWKDPWMVVSKDTFIGSALNKIGCGDFLTAYDSKYPAVQLEDFDRNSTLLLFSSEPYPFHRKIDEIKQLGFSSAIVDGELFSWFGIRSYRFLKAMSND